MERWREKERKGERELEIEKENGNKAIERERIII